MCWKFRNISCKTILGKSILRYFCNILYKIVEFNIHLKTGHQQISVTLFIIKSGKVLSFKFYNLSHQIYCQIYQIFGSSEQASGLQLGSGLRPKTLLKKRLQHRGFPVNFVKFLRISFFAKHLQATASDLFIYFNEYWFTLNTYIYYIKVNGSVYIANRTYRFC